MTNQAKDDPHLDPVGTAFLECVARIEMRHERGFTDKLPTMGEKLPKCVAALADVLRRLDDEATCRFECKGGQHFREGLVASIVSTAYATLRLVKCGYIDQAFALIRSAAEAANLIYLFALQSSAFLEWAALGDQERRRKFSAVQVRLALEAAGAPLPIDQDTYRALSGFGVHHEPSSMPQRYNAANRGMTVPLALQPPATMAALNELAGVIAVTALTAPRLLAMPPSREDALRVDVDRLLENIGKVDALALPSILQAMRSPGRKPESS